MLALVVLVAACGVHHPAERPDMASSSAQARLARLMAERNAAGPPGDYQIGPGDRLQLTVVQAEALTGEFEFARDGTLLLPILGTIGAAGRTERAVAADIAKRLADGYVRSPEVVVAVTSFVGRRASVVGAVGNPGFQPLRGGRETILDVVMRAGGFTDEAGPILYFSPRGEAQLEVDLSGLYQDRPVEALELLVRDGDTIYVAPRGEIVVEGWVERPAPYPLERAMTLTQAISRAGGLHFAASPHTVVVSRPAPDGARRTFAFDYARLADGAEPDLPLRPGDHVEVAGAPVKVAAWGVYHFVSSIVGVAISGTVALF